MLVILTKEPLWIAIIFWNKCEEENVKSLQKYLSASADISHSNYLSIALPLSLGPAGYTPIFNYSSWGRYVLMMSWFLESLSSFASLSSNAFCTCQGRGLVVIAGSLQLVRPRAETEHNSPLQHSITFPTVDSPFPCSVYLFSSQLLFCLSLIFSLSCLLSFCIFLNLNNLTSPSPFVYFLISVSCSLSLRFFCFLFLTGPCRGHLVRSFRLFSWSLLGLEKAHLPVRSWGGTLRP